MKLAVLSPILFSAVVTRAVTITSVVNSKKCIDVRGGAFQNGTAVQIYDCNGSTAQNWIIDPTGPKFQVANTNYCLDSGTVPQSGVGLKIWQCFSNLPAQSWFYTSAGQIQLGAPGQTDANPFCVDLPRGDTTNSNQLQLWQCGNSNVNQIWISNPA